MEVSVYWLSPEAPVNGQTPPGLLHLSLCLTLLPSPLLNRSPPPPHLHGLLSALLSNKMILLLFMWRAFVFGRPRNISVFAVKLRRWSAEPVSYRIKVMRQEEEEEEREQSETMNESGSEGGVTGNRGAQRQRFRENHPWKDRDVWSDWFCDPFYTW